MSSCTFIKINGTNLSGKDTVEASSNVQTKTFEVVDFDRLTLDVPADVAYERADSPFLEISAPDNVMDQIVLTQEGSSLRISFRNKIVFRGLRNFKIRLGSSSLSDLNANGATDFDCLKGFTTDDFSVMVSGAGDLKINHLKASEVRIRINGAGDLNLDDTRCASLDVNVSGAGDIDVKNLNCDGLLKVVVNGAGDAEITGKTGEADLTINGAGTINVKGLEGPIVNSSVNGIGSISKRR